MNQSSARTAILTSAMLVAGIRMWMQIRGKTKTPFAEWAIGWGASFFIISLLSEAMPTAAGSLSLLIAFADFLNNGVGLTKDISDLIVQSEKGKTPTVFVPQPFAQTDTSGTVPKAA